MSVTRFALVLLCVPAVASAQMTNCMRDAVGGYSCMTTPTYQQPYVQTDWGAIFAKIRSSKINSRVGGMLAKGDCAGAEAYALKVGELGLAQEVRSYCSPR